MNILVSEIKKLYKDKANIIISLSLFFFSFGVYMIFMRMTTSSWAALWNMNSIIFNLAQIITSLVNAILISVAITMFIKIFKEKKKSENISSVQTIFAILFSLATTGCYVCGTVLLPTLGIITSLGALPFGGIEVKVLTSILLLYSIYEYSKTLSGRCDVYKDKLISFNSGKLLLNPSKNAFMRYKKFFIFTVFIILFISLPLVSSFYKADFANDSVSASQYSCGL
jgi:hypothetical protein